MKYLLTAVIVAVIAIHTVVVFGDKTTCKQYADGHLIAEYQEISITMPDGVVFEVGK